MTETAVARGAARRYLLAEHLTARRDPDPDAVAQALIAEVPELGADAPDALIEAATVQIRQARAIHTWTDEEDTEQELTAALKQLVTDVCAEARAWMSTVESFGMSVENLCLIESTDGGAGEITAVTIGAMTRILAILDGAENAETPAPVTPAQDPDEEECGGCGGEFTDGEERLRGEDGCAYCIACINACHAAIHLTGHSCGICVPPGTEGVGAEGEEGAR